LVQRFPLPVCLFYIVQWVQLKMTNVVSILENALGALTVEVIKRPLLTIWLTLTMVVIFAAGASQIYIDVSNESLFRDDDPTLKQYQAFQRQFGRDDAVIAAISSKSVFSAEFFSKLESLQRDLEAEVPFLDLVTSLVSVTSISSKNGDVLIDDLRELWPTDANKFPAFKQEIIKNPLYRNLIVSEDGETTLLIIQANAYASDMDSKVSFKDKIVNLHDRFMDFMAGRSQEKKSQAEAPSPKSSPSRSLSGELDLGMLPEEVKTAGGFAGGTESEQKVLKPLTASQLSQYMDAVERVIQRHQSEQFNIRLAGGQMIDAEHKKSIHVDLAMLLPIAFIVVFIVLYIVLRRISAVLLSLMVVIMSLLATIGFMGWIGSPITPVAVALPPLLLTIGVGDSVHLLGYFYSHLSKTQKVEQSIVYAVKRTGVPIVFTTLTTAAGFMAFVVSDIKSISSFGLLAAFGVNMALLISITMVPAVLMRMKITETPGAFERRWHNYARFMTALTRSSMRRPKTAIVVTVLLIAGSIPGVMQLRFSHDVLSWFPQDRPVRVNTIAVDKEFHGSIPLEVVIDTGTVNGIYEPEFMQKLAQFQQFAQGLEDEHIDMGRATSIVDTLKQIHLTMSNGNPAKELPDNRNLVAQELLLFEGSGASDVAKLIDSNFSKARVTVRMSWADAVNYVPVRNQIEQKAKEIFSGTATVSVTGSIDLVSRSLVGVMQSMSSSYLIAASVIALMLILLTRSVLYGLVGMIPNFLPIIITLGIMGYVGYPINMFTVLLGGIALGLAVDDTLHFMHGYRYHRRERGESVETGILNTVNMAGPALLFTTLAISLGFFLFTMSTMDSLFYFGIFLGLTLVNALIADIVLVPALLKFMDRTPVSQITSGQSSMGNSNLAQESNAAGIGQNHQ